MGRICQFGLRSRWMEDAFLLGTLAAEFAEYGEFDDAIKWQKKSLESEAYRKEYGKKVKRCWSASKTANPIGKIKASRCSFLFRA